MRIRGLVVCVLLLSSVVNAEIELVDQSLDYNYGGYFHDPEIITDHSPFYRGSWEDWGWTHDFTGLVPENATGIQWAQIAISAWDVDEVEGENDVIYINDVEVGSLVDTAGRNWVTSWLTVPPSLLDDLWQDGEVYVYMDIDAANAGHRVTLNESTLTVAYIVPEPATIGLLGLGSLLILKRRRS